MKFALFSFDAGPPDVIYLEVDDDLKGYIETPQIQYLGTIADLATFTYIFELVKIINGIEEIDGIWVNLTTQVYKNG